MRIDLNCDLGESFGRYTLGMDEQVIPLVSSCNIACGAHAGDPVVMRRTVELAKSANVSIGAHPGYPDLQGFGRRDLGMSPEEIYASVLFQIGALAAFCRASGAYMAHVKPHGQLYNRCAIDANTAAAVAAAVYDFDRKLVLVGLAGSRLIEAGTHAGLRTAGEFFTDRNYTDEGVLVNRREDNALVTDEDFAVQRVCRVVREGTIESVSGKTIAVQADTICVHGDNAHALEFVGKTRVALEEAGIDIVPVSRW